METVILQKRKPNKRRVKQTVGKVCVHAFLILFSFTCVFPFLWMVLSSFKTAPELINSLELKFFPESLQWSNYQKVFTSTAFNVFDGIKNTMIIEIATIPLCVFMSGLSAFAFSKMELPHKNFHLMVQLSALMIPYACMAIPLYRGYYLMGMINTFWPLILPSLFGGVSMMFFFVQFQRGIPNAIFESSQLDGAGYFRQYVSIMLPVMKPAIAAQVIFMFVGTWNDYFAPTIYLWQGNYTLQVMIQRMSEGEKVNLPLTFAASVISCIPLYAIYLIFQNYFIEGVSTGAVKG